MLWLLPLPLAIPTYLAAYVYVDLFEPLGLFHAFLKQWLPAQDAIKLLPRMRSLPGAIVVIGLVLYPYVYLSARAMFQLQSAEFAEAARVLGASRWTIFRRVSLPMARPALAVGLALVSLETLNDIGALEYLGVRTLTVSIFTTWLNRGSLSRRSATVGVHARHRRAADRDRAAWSSRCGDVIGESASHAAHETAWMAQCAGADRLSRAGIARLRNSADLSRARKFSARPVRARGRDAVARRRAFVSVRGDRDRRGLCCSGSSCCWRSVGNAMYGRHCLHQSRRQVMPCPVSCSHSAC